MRLLSLRTRSALSGKPLNQAARITEYLRDLPHTSPILVLDLAAVQKNYQSFRTHMPYARIFYAIKANAEPALLATLAAQGSSFDAASMGEITLALNAGAPPQNISFGNTIKSSRDIAQAYAKNIDIYAFDSLPELEKIAKHAPNSRVYCRLLCSGEGAKWPLSRKFGCTPNMATTLLLKAQELGLKPWGLSFHVGSQQQNPEAWDNALSSVKQVFESLKAHNIHLDLINMGGGFPARYEQNSPTLAQIAPHITQSLHNYFGQSLPQIIIEPGRAMVADTGIIRAQVLLISQKSNDDPTRWVYLDIGLFNGLNEAGGETLRYPLITPHQNTPLTPAILAGPTCDSADILYERTPMLLPQALQIDDLVLITHTGAYTSAYSTAAFNGFPALKTHCINP